MNLRTQMCYFDLYTLVCFFLIRHKEDRFGVLSASLPHIRSSLCILFWAN